MQFRLFLQNGGTEAVRRRHGETPLDKGAKYSKNLEVFSLVKNNEMLPLLSKIPFIAVRSALHLAELLSIAVDFGSVTMWLPITFTNIRHFTEINGIVSRPLSGIVGLSELPCLSSIHWLGPANYLRGDRLFGGVDCISEK